MKAVRPTLLLPLVLGLLVATAAAQEAGEPTPPELPDLASLGQTWWSYFEGTQEELGPRIEAFLEQVNAEIADLGAQNQELAPALVEAVRDNFEVYVSLLDDVDIQREPLPEPAEAYSLDDLLDAAATARGARTVAQAAQDEVEREQRTRDGVTRRRDAVFKNYLDAAEGDARWLAALRVVRARSALAISQRRLQILTESARYASTFADEAAERVELVRERLSTDADEAALEGLAVTVMRRSEALADAEERQREALIAASSLEVDTAQGRSQQRLQQQLALDADVDLAAARVALGITRPGASGQNSRSTRTPTSAGSRTPRWAGRNSYASSVSNCPTGSARPRTNCWLCKASTATDSIATRVAFSTSASGLRRRRWPT